jgi:NADPH-dependent ferric siderophore reductase
VEKLSPWMVRVRFAGDELADLVVDEPAASVRLLLPAGEDGTLVMPTWNGNEFLLPDGERAPIRTFTPSFTGPGEPGLSVDVVLHGTGAASTWAAAVGPGAPAALSGPGRGYPVDSSSPPHLLVGDLTAVPAMGQIVAALAPSVPVRLIVELPASDARPDLPEHPHATVEWLVADAGARAGEAMVTAVTGSEIGADTKVWVAGEAAAVQRIRRHLFDDLGLARTSATVRGYWKYGRAAT